jgi:hypothetical protein
MSKQIGKGQQAICERRAGTGVKPEEAGNTVGSSERDERGGGEGHRGKL